MASRREGATLGPYRIIQQVGLGGMATVYKAYQPSMERYVALKILPEHYARDPKFTQRFIREARTIAQLEHKNILPVYDFGEEDGVTYLAMRYLEGGTLKDVLELGHLTLADAADILSQVCSALDYAHRQGVVHRDVKPSNIMVNDDGEAYLTDFGIAKVLEGSEKLTGTGAALGTPAYMAPEQSLGKHIDGRADIYALGIMLYEMVVGRVPYQAETPMAVALAHIHEPLMLPREIDPTIPEPIEAVILKALAKDPDDRYQTASQLSAALNEAIAQAGIDPKLTRLHALATEARLSRAEEIATYDVPVSPFAPSGEQVGGMTRRRGLPLPAGTMALLVVAIMAIGGFVAAVFLGFGRQGDAPIGDEAEEPEVAIVAPTNTPLNSAAEGPPTTQAPTSTPAPTRAERIKVVLGDKPPDFEDNFDFLAVGWFGDGSPNFDVEDGQLIIQNHESRSGGGVYHRDVVYTDILFEAQLTLLEPSVGGDWGIWMRSPADAGGCHFMLKTLEDSNGFDLFCEEGRSNRPGRSQAINTSVGIPHVFTVVIIGDEITAAINGEEVGTIVDDTYPVGFTGFRVGRGEYPEGRTMVAVDWVRAWDLTGLDLDL